MKGVSTLIASVLLILIVVTLAGILVSYGTAWIKGGTETITDRSNETIECTGAAIHIDEVYVTNGTLATIRARVANTGSTNGLKIVSAQAFNSSGANFSASNLPVENFNVGGIAIIIFSNASIYKCSDLQSVSISTDCGVASDTYKKAPVCAT